MDPFLSFSMAAFSYALFEALSRALAYAASDAWMFVLNACFAATPSLPSSVSIALAGSPLSTLPASSESENSASASSTEMIFGDSCTSSLSCARIELVLAVQKPGQLCLIVSGSLSHVPRVTSVSHSVVAAWVQRQANAARRAKRTVIVELLKLKA